MKLLVMLTLMASLAHAGQGGGNGGGSVVCRNKDRVIMSAELLDIYEGKVLYGRSYDHHLPEEEYFDRVANRLDRWPGFKADYLKQLEFIKNNITFISSRNVLSQTNDVTVVVMLESCKYEQLANYTDINEVFVSEEIYYSLSSLSQTALLVHEAIYFIFRQNQQHHERVMDARRLTAQLLAESMNDSVVNGVMARSGWKK